MTRISPNINLEQIIGYVDINPRNTGELDIKDGDTLILSSCRAQMESRAKLSNSVTPGSLFRPINFGENPTNVLTNAEAFDLLAKILEFKVSAVNIAKLSE